MCCFSRPVDLVAGTNIFARAAKKENQFLVYSMTFKAGEELAMILPLPTPKESKEDALHFINLEKYPDFFEDMVMGYPVPRSKSKDSNTLGDHKLKVVEVGSFLASFVPTVKDFKRLDEQFRLPDGTWDKLPTYADYGFAVFKLKKGEMKVHPMAFEFPRRDPKKLFFPTVHIHDGKVHKTARFDHHLYCQADVHESTLKWEESMRPAGMFMKKLDLAQGIVDPKGHVYRHKIIGVHNNTDTWL